MCNFHICFLCSLQGPMIAVLSLFTLNTQGSEAWTGKHLVQVHLVNKRSCGRVAWNWGRKHMNHLACCTPKASRDLGPVQCMAYSPCVPLSQKRSLVWVSLDVYLASCLSLCLSYSITVKGQKKKYPRAGNILFPTKRIFCSQLCGRKYFSCGLGMGWIPSLLGQCLRTKPMASHQVSTQYAVFFKWVSSDVECMHKWTNRSVWVA